MRSAGAPGSGRSVTSCRSNRASGRRTRAAARKASEESRPTIASGRHTSSRSSVVKAGPQPRSTATFGFGIALAARNARDTGSYARATSRSRSAADSSIPNL